jgi:hypothetical protein
MTEHPDRFTDHSPSESPRRYTEVVHAAAATAASIDADLIAHECAAVIAAQVHATPTIDVIATRCTADVFVALELTTSEDPWRVRRALDAACGHILDHAGRFGLATAHRTTALTDPD